MIGMESLIGFSAGALGANGLPHFVMGATGSRFQTPFARPPGIGESSPVVNVVWGFVNWVGCFLLLELAKGEPDGTLPILEFGAGALATGLFLAWHFGRVRNPSPR